MHLSRPLAPTTRRFRKSVHFAQIALVALLSLGTATLVTADSPQATPNDLALASLAKSSWTALEPLEVHPRTSLTIVEQLRHNHYLKKPLDDDISSQIFDKYLEMLDGGRSYFLNKDIAEMEKYRHSLDDALKRGDLEPAFQIFNQYQSRLVDRLEYLLEQLGDDFKKVDFSVDESIEIDRENKPWPSTQAEMNELWRKRLKAAALSMKLNGKTIEEINELLHKRYKNRLKQTKQTKSEDAFQLYVNAFAATYDPHTQYYSPRTSQTFNINMSLSLEGIGAVLSNQDEYTSVVRLVAAGPADKTGLIKPSDRIISVAQGEGPLIDVVGWRLDDVVELIRGPKGTTVRLEVVPSESESGESKIVEIVRNTVKLEEQAAQKKLITLNRGGQDYKIGVVEVPTFYVDFKAIQEGDPNYKSTTRDVKNLIEELKVEGIDGLVVDLRNNGGGSLQEADSLTGLFIKSGPTVQVKSARRRPNIYSDTDDEVTWDGPMAVMVNRLSASASEIFAGAIQDYQRGIIIGSQTFGKGTVQTLVPLNRGQLKITAAKFYRVSGQSTQHQGILPDVEFPEIYDIERIGESSLDDAMPWDMIQPAVYPSSDQIQPVLSEIVQRHNRRVQDDSDFAYLRALALKAKENSSKKFLSLNEEQRTKEKDADDEWRRQLENALRVSNGEKPYATVAEMDDALEAKANADEDEPADKDAMVKESGNVLLDYIGLSRQVAMLERVERVENIAP